MAEESLRNSVQRLQGDFAACSTASDAQVLVFITKMVAVPRSSLPQAGSYDTDEVFIAFARVFSGVLREDSVRVAQLPRRRLPPLPLTPVECVANCRPCTCCHPSTTLCCLQTATALSWHAAGCACTS